MIRTDIDFDRKGKQQGFLRVPYSHNLGGWANVMIPMTVVAQGAGPTVLVLGGIVVSDRLQRQARLK
jgi:N-alpha-acetyl-L-2,4-diaminobutyrate deacetylase